MAMGLLGGFNNFRGTCVTPTLAEVLNQGAVEEDGLLPPQADDLAQAVLGYVGAILPIDIYSTFLYIKEP